MENGHGAQNNFVGGILIGALLGGGLTLLFAPKPGAQVRRQLKEKTAEAYGLGKQKAKEMYAKKRENGE